MPAFAMHSPTITSSTSMLLTPNPKTHPVVCPGAPGPKSEHAPDTPAEQTTTNQTHENPVNRVLFE